MWLGTFGDTPHETPFYIFCGVSCLIFIITIMNLIFGCAVSRNSVSGSLDFNIVVGCFMIPFTVIAESMDPKWLAQNNYSVICKIYPVVLLIGLTQFIGGLFVKGWTVFLFYKYNREKRPLSEEWIPNILIWILIVIAAAVSLVWIFLFEPKVINENMCTSSNDFEWKVGTSAWHGLLLFLAFIAVPVNCAVTRGTQGSRDANILAVIVINTILCVIAGICLYYLYFNGREVDPKPTSVMQYYILGGITLWMCFFADVMLFISKICMCCSPSPYEAGGEHYDTIDSSTDRNSYVHPNPTYESANGKANETFEY